MVEKLVKAERGYKGKDLVVSLGAGSGITEISSKSITLFLDTYRRAIHTGLNEIRGRQGTNRTIFALMDYSENNKELLQQIQTAFPSKTIRVIMQHPNPSLGEQNRMNLKLLFYSLRMSITKDVLQDVTFVYDLATNRNTWNRAQLLSLLMLED